MIQYLLYCSSDCRTYGLFRSLRAAKDTADNAYKLSCFDFRHRYWVIDVLKNRSLVYTSFYKCPKSFKNGTA